MERLHPDLFLGKVPSSDASVSGAATFVPAWSFKEDNLAVDATSLRDFAVHVAPPVVADKIAKLSALDAKRTRLFMSYWNYMLQCDEIKRTEALADQYRTQSVVVARQEKEVLELQSRTHVLAEEKRVADEARAKAEATLLAVQTMKDQADAALAPLQQRTQELESENAALVARDTHLQRRFDELTAELAAAKKEIADLGPVRDENAALAADLGRLRKGIPDIVKKAIASDSVTTPFKEFLTAVQEVEVLRTVDLFAEHVENLPDPLPEAILSQVNPDCHARAQQASEALQSLSIPYVNRIASDDELSVEEILRMQP